MLDRDFRSALELLATREDLERLREHVTTCMERVRRDIHALIDAIELLKIH